jgi:hypothetical protein
VPGAPTITKVSRHSGSSTSVDVTFTAPSSNGGAAITQYIVKCSSGSPTACSSTTVSAGSSPQTVTVTGLTQGKYYTFVVDAVNSAGPGPDSNVSQAVTPNPTTPARVSRLSVHRQGHVVTFRWHVAIPSGIVGFNLYAGKSRINSHVIASHTGRDYTARVSTAHSGPYRLGVILSSGKVISVRGK